MAVDPLDVQQQQAKPLEVIDAVRTMRERLIQAEVAAVLAARAQGRSWAEIGEALGTTKQAAQQRYGLLASLAHRATVEVVPAPDAPRPRRSTTPAARRQQPKKQRRK